MNTILIKQSYTRVPQEAYRSNDNTPNKRHAHSALNQTEECPPFQEVLERAHDRVMRKDNYTLEEAYQLTMQEIKAIYGL